jgi:ribosomal protein L7/L12
MELWLIILAVAVVLGILNIERQSGNIRRDVARLDRKLNLLLKQMNVPYEKAFGLSERVKELARDPSKKINAIKVYREETGAGLKESKEAVEAWIESMQR